MQQSKQPVMYNSYGTQPNYTYFVGGQPGNVSTLYSAADSGEEPDEFLIGSSYYAIRTEHGAEEPDYNHYDVDDTTAHMLDLGIDEEETVNLNPMMVENAGLDQPDYHTQQVLEMEMERLRRENHELRTLLETRTHAQPNGHVEEEIEEEYRTIEPTAVRIPTFDVAIQSSGTSTKTAGVGNFSVDRYHLIDLHSDMINQSQYPDHYWSRLEDYFRHRFASIAPSTRDVSFQSSQQENRTTATMVTPVTHKERSCFGVTVRPMTQDVGVSCIYSTTREFGCTTVETDTMLKDWIDKNLRTIPEPQRKLVTQLVKSSSRSREEFVEHILKVIGKESKSTAVECKPEFRSSFTMTDEDKTGVPVAAKPDVLTESKLVEARPVMVNKPAMTIRVMGLGVATETDPPLMRSQGSQTEQKSPDLTGCGVQTDTADNKTSAVHVDHSVSTKSRVRTARSQERPTDSGYEDSRRHECRVKRRTSSYDAKHDERKKSGSTYSHSIQFRSSRPMSPNEMRELFPAYFAHGSPRFSPKSMPSEETHPPTEEVTTNLMGDDVTLVFDQADSYTISSEKRTVNEHSERHLLPTDADLDELTHGDPAALQAALSRSKPIATRDVIREFPPTVEVLYHTDDTDTLTELPEEFSQRTDQKAVSGSSSGDKRAHSIPVLRTTQKSDTSPRRSSQPVRVVTAPTSEPGSESVRIPLKVHVRSPSPNLVQIDDPSVPTLDQDRFGIDQPSSQTAESDGKSQRRSSGPYRLPPRNNSFTLPEEAVRACELLKECYQTGKLPSHDPSTKAQLAKLSDIWFNMATLSSSVSMAQLEDFLATLGEYHQDLVRDVIRSTDDQGLTSLHLAVGHGAWPVVNLILDSGYAEPDRLNRAGYSPIMVSTFGSTPSPPALTTLNRLYTLGNVNLHSTAGSGQTPLMLAAQNHAVEIAELLLLHNASINTQDRAGNTALMFAIQKGDEDMVGLLLDQPQLDLSLVDNRGEDALTIALHRGNQIIIDWIRNAIKYGCRKSAVFAVPPPPDSRIYRKRRIREILQQTTTSRIHTLTRPTRPSAKRP